MLENPFAFESAVCLRSRGMEGVQELVVTPVTCQLLPGSKFEDQCLVRAVERFRKASSVRRVCVIADRGVMSAAKLRLPENAGLNWILEARLRAPSNELQAAWLDLNDRSQVCDGGVLDLPAQANRRLIMGWSRKRAEQERADQEHLLVAVIFEDLDSSVSALGRGRWKIKSPKDGDGRVGSRSPGRTSQTATGRTVQVPGRVEAERQPCCLCWTRPRPFPDKPRARAG